MEFINQAVTVLQTLVVALGAGLAVWGVVNLMEGYGNDNPGAKSQGIKLVDGRWRRGTHRHDSHPPAVRFVLITGSRVHMGGREMPRSP
jgi:hypothetical protein